MYIHVWPGPNPTTLSYNANALSYKSMLLSFLVIKLQYVFWVKIKIFGQFFSYNTDPSTYVVCLGKLTRIFWKLNNIGPYMIAKKH
jgi:hypothetical protein